MDLIFNSKPLTINKVENNEPEEENNNKPYLNNNLSANQNLERENKTIFVGNLNIELSKKDILKYFKKYGKIDKLWVRSIPIKLDSKIPKKGRIIKKEFNEYRNNKNCYILFENKTSVEKALEMNGKDILGHIIRVNLANNKKKDYKKTIFIGNLPFIIEEDKLREHFKDCGNVENIRIIRDQYNNRSKGFGYITFKDKISYYNALKKNNSMFNNRNLRISKAVPESKLEIDKKTNNKVVIKKKKKINNEENYELLDKVKSLNGNNDDINKSISDNIYQHKPRIPQKILNKKIKKIKRSSDNAEDIVKKTLTLKKVEEKKFNKNILEVDNLLEKRRKLRKNKAENNKKYYNYKNILKKHN